MKKLGLTLSVVSIVVVAGVAQANKKMTNRQVIEKMFQIVDAKQYDKYGEFEVADLEMMTPMGPVKGSEGHKQMSQGFATAIPNAKHTITECVEAGEMISCEGRFGGDQTGPMTMPDGKVLAASGKKVDFGWVGFAKVKNGKITSLHVYFNPMEMMMQIGAMPPPATASKG